MAYEPPDEVGESHVKLSDAKTYLKRFSYGKAEGLGTTDTSDIITPGYLRAQRQYKNNIHLDFVKGRRPLGMPDLNPDNPDFDWATQKNMGLLAAAVPVAKPFLALNFTGTWGAWDNGFGWDVMQRLDGNRWDKQGLGYNTTAFLMQTTDHSYIDMINEGANEGLKWALPTRQKKGLFAYSGGCGAAREFLMRWPADRRDEIAIVECFGDPNRPPGVTLLGNDPGGHGISEDFPPDWILPRYYSFSLPGDMYPNATGLLPVFYDILVRLEMTPEFMRWFFFLIVDQFGNFTPIALQLFGLGGAQVPFFGQLAGLLPALTGGLAGLGGEDLPQVNLFSMLFNIPAIVTSLMKLLNFLISQDHGKYGVTPAFGGLTAVDRGAQIANALAA